MEDTPMQLAKCFEVYTPDGALIFRIYFTERELPNNEKPQSTEVQTSKGERGNEKGNGETMTPPQKRKLFKLLAIKGIEGNKAEDELKKLFRVKSLEEIRKFDASKMIDHLIQEGNGHGSSL
jgi:hypothetical protein